MAGLWAQGPVEAVTTPSFREMPGASPKGQNAVGPQQRTLSMGLMVERNNRHDLPSEWRPRVRALEAEFAVAETPGCRRGRHLPRYLHRVPGTPSLPATSRGHGQDWGCSCITLCFPRHCPPCPRWA